MSEEITMEQKIKVIIQSRHPLSKRLVNQRCILLYLKIK